MHDLRVDPDPLAAAESELRRLKAAGLDNSDPPQFAYLQALHRRAQQHTDEIRAGLAVKLQQRLAECAQQMDAGLGLHRAGGLSSSRHEQGAISPLADLLLAVQSADPANAQSAEKRPGHGVRPEDLMSLRAARSAWVRLRVDQEVAKSKSVSDDVPGPLNSPWLILRSLQRLQTLAPEYLEDLVGYAETLLWLAASNATESDERTSAATSAVTPETAAPLSSAKGSSRGKAGRVKAKR